MFGIGGGGGGIPVVGELTSGLLTAGDRGAGDSIADIGRGGPIVPKRIEASCFALPPVGLSSSSDSSSEDSTTDQSSSSFGAARVRAGAAAGSGRAVLFCSVVMRWNGFVDCPSAGCGDVMAELAGG